MALQRCGCFFARDIICSRVKVFHIFYSGFCQEDIPLSLQYTIGAFLGKGGQFVIWLTARAKQYGMITNAAALADRAATCGADISNPLKVKTSSIPAAMAASATMTQHVFANIVIS